MRLMTVAALVGLFATPALGDTMAHCSAAWKTMTPAQQGLMTYKAWPAKCLAKDYMVPANESQIPAGEPPCARRVPTAWPRPR